MLVRNIERYKWSPVRNQQEPLQYLDSLDIKKGEKEIYKRENDCALYQMGTTRMMWNGRVYCTVLCISTMYSLKKASKNSVRNVP